MIIFKNKNLFIKIIAVIFTATLASTQFYMGYKVYSAQSNTKPPSAKDYDFIIPENKSFNLDFFRSDKIQKNENLKDLQDCLKTEKKFCFLNRNQFQNIQEISFQKYEKIKNTLKNQFWITNGVEGDIKTVFIFSENNTSIYEIKEPFAKNILYNEYTQDNKIPLYKISKQDDLKTKNKAMLRIISTGITMLLP